MTTTKKKQKQLEWTLVGTISRNDMRGKDPVHKFHTKLKSLAPGGEGIEEYGMSAEALEYFKQQLIAIAKKRGFTKNAMDNAVGMAMLQYAPVEIEGVTGFQVYYRGK